MTKIGLIREGKLPVDRRVALTPKQCKLVMEKYPDLEIFVQPSVDRVFKDEEYTEYGIQLREDLSNCDILLGIKEVPIDMLIPNKTYMFFSHTFKKQPYNRKLLQTILEKKITLIDYEVITDEDGRRLIGFGRYAGIVGCYNAFLAAGKKWKLYDLKPAHQCKDRKEVEQELKKVTLPKGFKILITGTGRVARGALEIIDLLPIDRVDKEDYLSKSFENPVYTQLSAIDYVRRKDGSLGSREDFYDHPHLYETDFMKYATQTDMYIPCHYWDDESPIIFDAAHARHPDFRIKLVGDISCDVNGPIASTIRPSTYANPIYGYDPVTESETDFYAENAIGVMAIDNLPGELPKDASEDFGKELIENILPELLEKENSEIISRATQTNAEGRLTEEFSYLSDFVAVSN